MNMYKIDYRHKTEHGYKGLSFKMEAESVLVVEEVFPATKTSEGLVYDLHTIAMTVEGYVKPSVAPRKKVYEWQRVQTAPNNTVVLVHFVNDLGKSRIIRASYVPPFTQEADIDSEWHEYSQSRDAYYLPQGWYEETYSETGAYDYSSYFVFKDHGQVTHWMPLPDAPEIEGVTPMSESIPEQRNYLIVADVDKQTIAKVFLVSHRELSGSISDGATTADDLVLLLRSEIANENIDMVGIHQAENQTFHIDGFGNYAEVIELAMESELAHTIRGFYIVKAESIVTNSMFQAIHLGIDKSSVIAMWG